MPTRFAPLIGVFVGLVGAAAYWISAEIWPTSVAVVVSMIASALFAAGWPLIAQPRAAGAESQDLDRRSFSALFWIFTVLIKYNALMALSAANVPFTLPAYLTLGLIMIAAQAESRALVVSVMAADASAIPRVSAGDLTIALLIGLAPATLLGIPGLIGLATAIVVRLLLSVGVFPKLPFALRERREITQQVTEVCFYLGALATWKYI